MICKFNYYYSFYATPPIEKLKNINISICLSIFKDTCSHIIRNKASKAILTHYSIINGTEEITVSPCNRIRGANGFDTLYDGFVIYANNIRIGSVDLPSNKIAPVQKQLSNQSYFSSTSSTNSFIPSPYIIRF